jgi:hydroxyacylglutathione hydrolase
MDASRRERTRELITDGWRIEMTTTLGQDYPAGWTCQPEETPLQLTPGHLRQLQATLKANNLRPGRYVLPEMIIAPMN